MNWICAFTEFAAIYVFVFYALPSIILINIFFAKWVIVQGVGWQKVSFFSYVVMLLQYFALILDK